MSAIRIISAEDRDGFNVRTLTLVFEVPSVNFDLNAAVRAAATEYCQTEKGRNTYLFTNCHNFNWGDFDLYVPEAICKKHGFRKLDAYIAEEFTDFNEQLVNEDDILEEEK